MPTAARREKLTPLDRKRARPCEQKRSKNFDATTNHRCAHMCLVTGSHADSGAPRETQSARPETRPLRRAKVVEERRRNASAMVWPVCPDDGTTA
jgi:hypothetical protein